MPFKLQEGDRVVIELKSSEIYEGIVEYVTSRSLELCEISCPRTHTTFNGNMTFYKNEVLHISKMSEKPEPQDVQVVNGDSFPTKKISMEPEEFHRLKQMTFDFIFVDSFGKRFDDAVGALSNRESIAVAGLGNSRGKGLGLLLMADFKQIYIFDMIWLVQLRGLKDILESTFITKVVHDGSALYDALLHNHKVEMKNIFDTKIVDSKLSANKNEENVSRNISEILTYHFNFPPSLLSAAVDDMVEKTWVERPIVKNDRIKAAQLVTYLLPLRDRLMAQILKPYTSAIQNEYVKNRDLNLIKLKN